MSGSLIEAEPVGTCDPASFMPTEPLPPGCEEWQLLQFTWNDRYLLTASSDTPMHDGWETLPFFACGWYGENGEPCPETPPPTTITHHYSDTLGWETKEINTSEHSVDIAIALKKWLIEKIGYTYTLSEEEQKSLTGSHVEGVDIQLVRQPFMCRTRYYRRSWIRRLRRGEFHRDHNYAWAPFCGGDRDLTHIRYTVCDELMSRGTVIWDTYPNYEWAPAQPPCGGVPIQNPDPWEGKREKPCCDNLCQDPPAEPHPCCGCVVQQ